MQKHTDWIIEPVDIDVELTSAELLELGTKRAKLHDTGTALEDRAASVAKDFKAFIRHFQTSHVFTSPHYPQSNGKIERFHRTLKEQAIRPKTPLNLNDAKRITKTFIDHYNQVRLHSAIGYIAPSDRRAKRQQSIFQQRDLKLEAARQIRKHNRQQLAAAVA